MDMFGVFGGQNYARGVVQGLLKAKVALETHAQIDEALEGLGQVQVTMFEMRDELFRFRQVNEDLRVQLKARDDWDSRLAEYRLVTTPGGAKVFEHTEVPRRCVCPSCSHDRQIQVVQDRRIMSGVWDCPGCKVMYSVDPSSEAAARTARSPYLEWRRRQER